MIISIANAGVVFQEAKEEKAVSVVNENRLILFLFRLSNIPPSKTALLDERTSKMRRAHFPNERNLWSE